jgi:hypothetical protein
MPDGMTKFSKLTEFLGKGLTRFPLLAAAATAAASKSFQKNSVNLDIPFIPLFRPNSATATDRRYRTKASVRIARG